jgi:hypothetical protein
MEGLDTGRQKKEELDNAITEMWNRLGEAIRECFPPFRPKANYTSWWSPYITTLRKQVNYKTTSKEK